MGKKEEDCLTGGAGLAVARGGRGPRGRESGGARARDGLRWASPGGKGRAGQGKVGRLVVFFFFSLFLSLFLLKQKPNYRFKINLNFSP